MTTAHEALRRCVEAMKEVDFADCGKDDARWHKLNAAQQVAEEVLKLPVQEAPKIVAYAVMSSTTGIHKLSIKKDSADRKASIWREQWPNNSVHVRGLVFADAAPVAAQQAVAAQGWINVEDRLPEEGETVAALIYPYNNQNNRRIVTHSVFSDGTFMNHEGDDLHPPTHWMPLPSIDVLESK